ncbi:MAG TPA: hypothetical protein VL381_05595 [Rhodocyclaceae bacterium]|nr:hypothetical protein [Rhodocyclaceae bacterium]
MAIESVSSTLPAAAILGPAAISALAVTSPQTDVLALPGAAEAQDSTLVTLSDNGQLLSALADLSASGNTDILNSTQNFVELFNSSSTATSSPAVVSLFDSATVDTNTQSNAPTPVQDSLAQLGITVQPSATTDETVQLQLDQQALGAAVSSDAASTTDQLSGVAGVIEAALLSAQQTSSLPLTAADLASSTSVASVGAITPVVPNLVEVNNALRRSLAESALEDAITAATNRLPVIAAEAQPPLLQTQPATRAADATTAVAAQEDAIVTATSAASTQATVAAPATTTATDTAAAPTNAPNTSFEQANLVAANPATASSVAAFNNVVDNGLRLARPISTSVSLDVVNPVEIVSQTEAIGPNLANSSNENQRRQAEQDFRQQRIAFNRIAA